MSWQNYDIVLHADQVQKTFGKTRVLANIDLRLVRGQFVGLVGGSGSGKSTLLNLVNGTHRPTQSSLWIAP